MHPADQRTSVEPSPRGWRDRAPAPDIATVPHDSGLTGGRLLRPVGAESEPGNDVTSRLWHDGATDSWREGDRAHHRFETGTTLVAIATNDGVVVAADRRASLGGRFTTSKRCRKIEAVHPRGVVAISGNVGDGQTFADVVRAEVDLFEVRRGVTPSATALSRIAANVVRGRPVVPLLGVVDTRGGHVFSLDPGGAVLEDAYAASGSGMQLAYGLLERRFDDEIDLETARSVALDAVAVASERDTASGNGAHLATVTDAGVEIETVVDPGDALHRDQSDTDHDHTVDDAHEEA